MASIKLAVVAPPQEPYLALFGDVHLCQAAWYVSNPYYAHVYKNVLRKANKDSFIILDWQHISTDAPAHGLHFMDFLRVIDELRPEEIIIPDEFKDADNTLRNAESFFADYQQAFKYEHDYRPRFMFIPQGETVLEWLKCLNTALVEFGDKFQVVGIPKVLESFEDNARTRLVNDMLSFGPGKYNLHMLGVWRGVREMQYHPHVRSWDTSLPVAAAQQNHYLDHWPNQKYQLSEDEDDICSSIYTVIDNVNTCRKQLLGSWLRSVGLNVPTGDATPGL
jgi:hypothetical protein